MDSKIRAYALEKIAAPNGVQKAVGGTAVPVKSLMPTPVRPVITHQVEPDGPTFGATVQTNPVQQVAQDWVRAQPVQAAGGQAVRTKAIGGLAQGGIAVQPGNPRQQSAEDAYIQRMNAAVKDAIPFVKRHEGFRPKAYRIRLGTDKKTGLPIYDKWTIGYGQTERNGKPIAEGDTITEQEAAKFLEQRIRSNAAYFSKTYPWSRKLSQGGLSSVLDLIYNAGTGIVSKAKSPGLTRSMEDSTTPAETDEILRRELPTYIKANGIRVEGLLNRRKAAIREFLKRHGVTPADPRSILVR